MMPNISHIARPIVNFSFLNKIIKLLAQGHLGFETLGLRLISNLQKIRFSRLAQGFEHKSFLAA